MDLTVGLLLSLEALFALFLLYREGLLQNKRTWIAACLLLAAAFALRAAAMNYETLDYRNFLTRWVSFFRRNGGFEALALPVGNYNIPYLYFLALFSYCRTRDLYLIKLLSIFFDVVLAWSCEKLCARVCPSPVRRLSCFFAALFWPTVLLNGAIWGQCDSIYTALALLALALALEDRPVLSMLCITLSFSFKLQAVFVMPVFAVLWMAKKFKWQHFLLFPAVYLLLVLPAVLLGRPFWETLTLYASQTGSIGDALNYNSPSLFAVFNQVPRPERASAVGIILALVYMLNILAMAFVNRRRLNDRSILACALLFAVGIPFLLPHMHERYFFTADMLSLALAFAVPLYSLSAPLTEFASLLGYHAYLKMRFLLPMRYGTAALAVVLVLAMVCFFAELDPPPKPQARKKPAAKPKRGAA